MGGKSPTFYLNVYLCTILLSMEKYQAQYILGYKYMGYLKWSWEKRSSGKGEQREKKGKEIYNKASFYILMHFWNYTYIYVYIFFKELRYILTISSASIFSIQHICIYTSPLPTSLGISNLHSK